MLERRSQQCKFKRRLDDPRFGHHFAMGIYIGMGIGMGIGISVAVDVALVLTLTLLTLQRPLGFLRQVGELTAFCLGMPGLV